MTDFSVIDGRICFLVMLDVSSETVIVFENLFKPRQLASATSKPCFEQPAASFLVCSLIFIEYKLAYLLSSCFFWFFWSITWLNSYFSLSLSLFFLEFWGYNSPIKSKNGGRQWTMYSFYQCFSCWNSFLLFSLYLTLVTGLCRGLVGWQRWCSGF